MIVLFSNVQSRRFNFNDIQCMHANPMSYNNDAHSCIFSNFADFICGTQFHGTFMSICKWDSELPQQCPSTIILSNHIMLIYESRCENPVVRVSDISFLFFVHVPLKMLTLHVIA